MGFKKKSVLSPKWVIVSYKAVPIACMVDLIMCQADAHVSGISKNGVEPFEYNQTFKLIGNYYA